MDSKTDIDVDIDADVDVDFSAMTGDEARLVLQHLLAEKIVTASQIRDSLQVIPKDTSNDIKTTTTTTTTTFNNNERNPDSSAKHKHKTNQLQLQTKKKKKKTRPAKEYRTRPIALRLAYDGATHSGFTETLGLSTPDNSIERHLFLALQKSCLIQDRSSCHYSRAGRTDKGVSAHGQVIALNVRSAIPLDIDIDVNKCDGDDIKLPKNSFDAIQIKVRVKANTKKRKTADDGNTQDQNETEKDLAAITTTTVTKTIKELDYPYILNNILPPTIRILGWCPVSSEFSARFSASGRHYKYFFVERNLNIPQMNQGLSNIVGKHDFRNLCKINAKEVFNFERVIYDAKVVSTSTSTQNTQNSSTSTPHKSEDKNNTKKEKDVTNARQVCYMDIKGQAFLWHQIRCIASLHFLIGKNLEAPSLIPTLLDVNTNPCKPSYEMASDHPLVLHSCLYKSVTFGYSVQSLWNVMEIWEQQWEDAMIQAERLRDAINSLREDGCVKLGDVKEFYTKFVVNKKLRRRSKKRKQPQPQPQQNNNDDDDDDATMERSNSEENDMNWLPQRYHQNDNNTLLKWGEAMDILYPHVQLEQMKHHHIPIMNRAKGTSYEEKLQAIMSTDKKREKYEVDVLSKQKPKQEDKKFYEHMTSQGGSAWD